MSLKPNTTKSPIFLSNKEIDEFSYCFRIGDYEIITTAPSTTNIPDGIAKCFTDVKFYQLVLDDVEADFNYFSIKYETARGGEIIVPVGVYGISRKFKTRFPLLLSPFWRDFLMMNKSIFCHLGEIKENQDFYYTKILDLRKDFIRKIFAYYSLLDSTYCSAMAWELRNERSTTRTIAESLKYNRIEFFKSEIYSSIVIDCDKWEYLKQCLIDWIHFDKGELEQTQAPDNAVLKLRILARGIVNYSEFKRFY
jgi:hypothetical protein